MADKVEIVNDLTPEQLQETLEPKPVIVGNEDEIEQIKKVFDTELLPTDEDETPTQDAATPARPSQKEVPVSVVEGLDIDGQHISLDKVKNAYKFWSATNQRAAQNAADRRRLEEERAQFERDRRAADERIDSILKERLPPPPPKKPEPIQVDLSSIGPRPQVPDISTLEGQENYAEYERQRDEWDQKRLALVIQATRKQAESQAVPAEEESRTPVMGDVPMPVFDHNMAIGRQFKAPEVLAEFGIDEAKAQSWLERMDRELSPVSPDGRWTLNEVRVLARRFQEMERDAATNAARAAENASARRSVGTIKKAADASDVVRGGGAPAQRSLKIGDVLAMPVGDLRRRVVGSMKGRGGSEVHGLDPLYRTWEEMEKIS